MEIIYEKAVFAPKGGKPGYIVNGKWYPVDSQDLKSSAFKQELERYGRLRGAEQLKKDEESLSTSRRISSPPQPPASQPPASQPPASQPPAQRAQVRPSAPAPKPIETRTSSVTGKREFVGTSPSGEKFERRAATSAELKAAQAARQAALTAGKTKPEAEKAAVSAGISASKTQKEAFDLVLEYLTSEGHVESLEEALYVMMEMDSETIQSICEAAADQSDKQIEKGVKTTYKAGNVLDNQHQGRSRGLNRLSATERAAKIERMRKRLKARRDNLFGERNKREDAAREEMRRKYGL